MVVGRAVTSLTKEYTHGSETRKISPATSAEVLKDLSWLYVRALCMSAREKVTILSVSHVIESMTHMRRGTRENRTYLTKNAMYAVKCFDQLGSRAGFVPINARVSGGLLTEKYHG